MTPDLRSVTASGRDGCRHRFAGSAPRSQQRQPADDVDFDTDLMRLAAGGTSRPAQDLRGD